MFSLLATVYRYLNGIYMCIVQMYFQFLKVLLFCLIRGRDVLLDGTCSHLVCVTYFIATVTENLHTCTRS